MRTPKIGFDERDITKVEFSHRVDGRKEPGRGRSQDSFKSKSMGSSNLKMRKRFRLGEGSEEGLRPVSKEYLFHSGHFELEILVGTQVEMSRRS